LSFLETDRRCTVAVCWHLRCGPSYRDVEGLLAGLGVEVDQVTVYRWVQRFTRPSC
jgi:transposase-like protein